MTEKTTWATGRCLCGSITYTVTGPLRAVMACHCTQCRKTSGHYVTATQVYGDDLSIEGATLKWFRSSDSAERAFCATCGSNLFWRPLKGDRVSIFAGSLDTPSGVHLDSQIHPESAGSYYRLPNVPVRSQTPI